MSTTQRSENMHAFFDGYVNSKTTLKQFVEQYENALCDKVEKENEADFRSWKSWIPCITGYPMEKQFQEAYTTAKFKEFQQELTAKLHCEISSFRATKSEIEYIVKEVVGVGETCRSVPFVVCYDDRGCDVRCNCRLWRKNVYRCHTKIRVSYNSWSTTVEGERFDQLSNSFSEVADLASTNIDDSNMVMHMITDMKKKLLSNERAGGIDRHDDMSCHSGSNFDSVHANSTETSNKILTPLDVRCKGRPPFKRKQSKLEQNVRKGKQKKFHEKVCATTSLNRLYDGGSQETKQANEPFQDAINFQGCEKGVHILNKNYSERSVTYRLYPADSSL
ncbi:protein FAR-RED IMPAIRED RESPONSE 1-like [Pistacia vera]|uniref:protein FAR-RED IMPAIRED RESPONSE 1-like n=1 Tax=Pistacia vera TaxID=55513 RepID=UPI001263B01F|nr:protein FAR-RED IMPAIRED RESPONSE 1-like [Pistacia vera]